MPQAPWSLANRSSSIVASRSTSGGTHTQRRRALDSAQRSGEPPVVAAGEGDLRLRRDRRHLQEECGIDDLHVGAEFVHVAEPRLHVEQFAGLDAGAALGVIADDAASADAVDHPVAEFGPVGGRVGVGAVVGYGPVALVLRGHVLPGRVGLVDVGIGVDDVGKLHSAASRAACCDEMRSEGDAIPAERDAQGAHSSFPRRRESIPCLPLWGRGGGEGGGAWDRARTFVIPAKAGLSQPCRRDEVPASEGTTDTSSPSAQLP